MLSINLLMITSPDKKPRVYQRNAPSRFDRIVKWKKGRVIPWTVPVTTQAEEATRILRSIFSCFQAEISKVNIYFGLLFRDIWKHQLHLILRKTIQQFCDVVEIVLPKKLEAYHILLFETNLFEQMRIQLKIYESKWFLTCPNFKQLHQLCINCLLKMNSW